MSTIYLDHAATTPMRAEVREAMRPYLEDGYGNPSSTHARGRQARGAIEEARSRLAAVIGASRREIVFTGGGTEADNLAVLGRWRHAARRGRERGEAPPGVACSAVEHSAVLRAARQAALEGAALTLIAVDEDGRVSLEAAAEAIAARPAVVSVMWGNNEVGTLQPVDDVARLCGEAGVVFHSDAVQALGKVPVRVDLVPCHLLSISAHKLGGPQGAGALFIRDGVELEPILHGGGQENGLRSGTHNVAGAIGLAVAAELSAKALESESLRLRGLRDRLASAIAERVENVEVNAAGAERLPQILNLALHGVEPDAALMALDMEGICVSTGSACKSGSVGPSHVLVAMGRVLGGSEGAASAFIRFSLGHTTTATEVDEVIERFPRVVERLRSVAAV